MRQHFTLCMLIICICMTASAQVTPSWKEYKRNELGFTIKYPPTWELKDKEEGALFFLHSPHEGETDKFNENFNLQVSDLKEKQIGVKEYIKANTEELKEIDKFKKISEREFYWFGKQSFEVVFTGSVLGIATPLKWMQWYVVNKDKVYVITYCAESEKKDNHEKAAGFIFKTIRVK
jgi:hypothetical protein